MCTHPATSSCQVLRSDTFAACHASVPPMPFLELCQQNACHSDEVCDLVSAYARLCRMQGVCVDWRSSDFCRKRNSRLHTDLCHGLDIRLSDRAGCGSSLRGAGPIPEGLSAAAISGALLRQPSVLSVPTHLISRTSAQIDASRRPDPCSRTPAIPITNISLPPSGNLVILSTHK